MADNEELPFELNLYSQDQFINIDFNSEDGSKYELNIHDVTGRKIFTGKLQSSYNEQINVASGIYVYAVNKNNKIVKTGKVAVN
ncbi:MAG: T9SS type A sorting domain-containing protein [Bacteroidetes bacterium]|nr:T9SS type A sorting domain-containing protein [Bacteroidota bacterium]